MNSSSDPFPPTMSGLDSPQLFHTEVDESLRDGTFFTSSLAQDSPGIFYHADNFATSPVLYNSPINMSAKANGAEGELHRANGGPALSTSPESSIQDSSSDSSGRQKRGSTSTSPGNAGEDLTMADAPPSTWKGDSPFMGRAGHFDTSASNQNVDYAFNYPADPVDGDLFDFDSAANSPSPAIATSNEYNGSRHIAIPYRDSPIAAASFGAPQQHFGAPQGISPYSNILASDFEQPPMQHSGHPPVNLNEEYLDNMALNSLQQPAWMLGNQPPQSLFSGDIPQPASQHAPLDGLLLPGGPQDYQSGPSLLPSLIIHQTPHKSRVETQIPIKMTLFPIPPGVTKLHLPPYTISKPKLLAKPPPAKSADTLELYTMLVCTSAMQDPEKKRRALERAVLASHTVKEEAGGRRSSSGDAELVIPDEDQPLNGGEVKICVGCITRERKRAARKKSKKPEEEEPWQKDEAKRIIVFNTPEVKDWQPPSLQPNTVPNGQDGGYENAVMNYEAPSPFPDTARQIDAPMRIACYCRHQNEKQGFQVIFTIKDHQDNFVAQAMTNPIVITDDHKTHPLPNSTQSFTDHAHMPGGAMFGREHLDNYGSMLFRNAHSATDLPNLQLLQQQQQHSFAPRLTNSHTISPFAIPQQPSHTTSATMTPRNQSRQASPSTPAGHLHKKRKASGPAKIPDGLTMTKLETANGIHSPNQGWTPVGPSMPVSPAIISPFTPTFPTQINTQHPHHAPQRSGQWYTGPPTPNSNDHVMFSPANRTQSLENLSAAQHMFSTPNSALQSRAPSPTSGAQNAIVVPSGPPTTAVYGPANHVNRQRHPTIHKLIPSEGTKAGGIEVTCLGSGFHQGLEVMFGDSLATTTTYWGDTSIVCLLPPAIRAGTVVVMFKHQFQQQRQAARYPSPPISKQQILFKYVDEDEQDLLKHALLLVHQKMTGKIEDVGDIARRIINSNGQNSQGPWNSGNQNRGEHHRQVSALQTCLSTMDVEAAVLKCLDVMDLDVSPFQAQLNMRRPNGQRMLHLGSSLGFHRLVAGLLARGANPDARDANGMSPMHMAALNGHAQIVRRLRLAGGDPCLRSLAGFTPGDMASSQEVLSAVQVLQHSRARSAGTNSSLHSRVSSTTSFRSLYETRSIRSLNASSAEASEDDDQEAVQMTREIKIVTQRWAKPRRESGAKEPLEPVGVISPIAAMTALRDQLAVQIQHFQQNMNLPTFQNLQLPTLPPMPYLPDYQTNPVVRRFSSLVPQRNSRPSTSSSRGPDSKEGEYKWWELITGPAAPPPAYNEIYPAKQQEDLAIKRSSAVATALDTLADQKCISDFDMSRTERSISEKDPLRQRQQNELRLAHARKVKKLRSDRNLFFIWIPLLVFVILATLTDKVPKVWQAAKQAREFFQSRYHNRILQEL